MFFMGLGKKAKLAASVSVAVFIGFTSTASQAATLSAGFSYNAAVDVLTDGNTEGLSWLNLNKTRNLSKDEVLSEMGTGGDYEGYRYASGQEVNKLIGNWLGTTVTGIYNEHSEGLFDDLIMFIGDTYGHYAHAANLAGYQTENGLSYGHSDVQHIARGILSDSPTFPLDQNYTAILWDQAEKPWEIDYSSLTYDYLPSYYKRQLIGSFLVQTDPVVSAVPLPAGLPLYAAGLGLMGFIGWRRKRSALES